MRPDGRASEARPLVGTTKSSLVLTVSPRRQTKSEAQLLAAKASVRIWQRSLQAPSDRCYAIGIGFWAAGESKTLSPGMRGDCQQLVPCLPLSNQKARRRGEACI